MSERFLLHCHEIDDDKNIFIDGHNLSKPDALTEANIDEVQSMALAYSIMNMYMSTSQKTMMNSIYGGTANKYYYFCSVEAAEDITAEGRHYIQLGQDLINMYFYEKWHLDKDLHRHLKTHEKLKGWFVDNNPDADVIPLNNDDEVMYIDTDSLYVTFEPVLKSIGFKLDSENSPFSHFIEIVNDFRLRSFFEEEFSKVVNSRHGENFLKFDLESVSETTIFVKKKKYIMSYKMEDGSHYDDATDHIKGKGVEIIQSTMSNEVKQILKFLIIQFFKGKLNKTNYNSYMRYIYKQFCDMPIVLKSTYQAANTYKQYVLNDVTGLEFAKGTDAVVKGMALHNFKINQNNLKDKYEFLVGGKVAWYYTEDGGSFAYPIGEFPEDIAEPFNNGRQFERLIANPIGRIACFGDIDTSNPLSEFVTVEL